jgi:sugar phosphate isomerase/epimerase
MSIAGLNCNDNPLYPNPDIGEKHAEDLRRSIRLGQNRVLTVSGLPGGEPSTTAPNWIVDAWNSAALDVLDYQWDIAVKFWKEIDQLAREMGPVAVVRELGSLVLQAAAKDMRINKEKAALYGCWTTASAGAPPTRTAPTSAAMSGSTNGPKNPPGTSSPWRR